MIGGFFNSAKTYRLLCSVGASCTVQILRQMFSELVLEVEVVVLEMKQQFPLQNNFLPERQRPGHEFGYIVDIANQVQDRQSQCIVHKNYGRSLSYGSAD